MSIYGTNSPGWTLAFLSAVFAGGKGVGIYPSNTPSQLQFKCNHANGAIIAVDGERNFLKVKEIVDKLPYLKGIICWGDIHCSDVLKNGKGEEVKVYSFEDLRNAGKEVSDETLQKRLDSQKPGESCCYIYTNGTAGKTKAVMLSHDNILFSSFNMF